MCFKWYSKINSIFSSSGLVPNKWQAITSVFALRFENLLARNLTMKIFKHQKEEKFAGPTGNFAGSAPFLVASGLGPALNSKTVTWTNNSHLLWHIDYKSITSSHRKNNHAFNSLAHGKFEWNFIYLIFKWISVIDGWGISSEIVLIWMPLDFTDDQSTL